MLSMSNYFHILIGCYDLLEERCVDDIINIFLVLYYTKHKDSMLLCVCLKIDHRKHLVRTQATHSLNGSCASSIVLNTF